MRLLICVLILPLAAGGCASVSPVVDQDSVVEGATEPLSTAEHSSSELSLPQEDRLRFPDDAGYDVQFVSFFAEDQQPVIAEETGSPETPESELLVEWSTMPSDSNQTMSFGERLWNDHVGFYSPAYLGSLAAGVGVAALMANTSVDKNFRDMFLENVKGARSDEWFEAMHEPKFFGEYQYSLPVFGGLAVLGNYFDEYAVAQVAGQWAERSLRTAILGGPPTLLLQYATGASRPDETESGSHWSPFQDTNGVSGHTFTGAVPFLSAAMMTDNAPLKAIFYVASTLPGWSRINDDGHYASQVVLGWWIAYLAARSVDITESTEPRDWSIAPLMSAESVGLSVGTSF